MRPLRVLAVLPLVALTALFAACEDSGSSSGGSGFTNDAGGGFEASTPEDSSTTPEAATDAGVDAPVVPKGVTVTVVKAAAPQKDVRVLAHDATGAITSDVKTDAAGKVTFAKAPSMVTVLNVVFGGPAALTYLGVEDGDNLVVDQPTFGSEPSSVGTYAVTVGAFAGATFWQISVGGDGCGTGGNDNANPFNVTLYPYCLGTQNAVLVRGTGTSASYGFVKNVAKPAVGATVAVGPVTMNAAGSITLKGSNLPTTPVFYETEVRSIAQGFAYYTGFAQGPFDGAGSVAPMAVGFAEAYQSIVAATQSDVSPTTSKGFLRREVAAGAAPTLTYDFATALPYIGDAKVTGTLPRPDVAVTPEPGKNFAAIDGGVVRLQWTVTTGVSQTKQWSFVVPPGVPSFKVPELPADAEGATYLPKAGTEVGDVILVESSLIPSYAQVKAAPMPATGQVSDWTNAQKPLPANGTVRITTRGLYIVPPG